MTNPTIFPSPDNKHKAVLTYIGKTHTDHSLYSLSIEGFPHTFTDRYYGKVCLWSPDSRILAVQEWKKTDEEDDLPKACLLTVIDLISRRECIIANVEGSKGVILPESFIGESLMYTVIYEGNFGMTKSFESRFQYLDGWQTLK